MDIFREKLKFEKLLLKHKVRPLTVAYHGSLFIAPNKLSDLDIILIVESVTPKLLNNFMKSARKRKHMHISVLPLFP